MAFNDSLLFEKQHEDKARVIVADILFVTQKTETRSCPPYLLVGIGGPPGAGKSEIAWNVSRKLYKNKVSSHVIALDRFYIAPVERRASIRDMTGMIGPEEIDWYRVQKEVDFWKEERPVNVLILEGLYALYPKEMNLRVHIKGSPEDSYAFRKRRGKEDPDDKERNEIVKREHEACEALAKERANLIL